MVTEKARKVSGNIQNELLCLMAHSVLHKIANSVHENTHYALVAGEVTDLSNREQFVVCYDGLMIEHLL